MDHRGRRKCKCCLKFFRPDPRNQYHQEYCSTPDCRLASKAASRARWLAKPQNHDYHRSAVHVARVQAWRARHPQYWRRCRRRGIALQDLLKAQPIDSTDKITRSPSREILPLQDLLVAQPAVLIGLIAHMVGPLQDDIVRTTGRLLRLGRDILAESAIDASGIGGQCGAGRDRLRDVLPDP
jgi:hypothetical protein